MVVPSPAARIGNERIREVVGKQAAKTPSGLLWVRDTEGRPCLL